jgi:hypothetical protein
MTGSGEVKHDGQTANSCSNNAYLRDGMGGVVELRGNSQEVQIRVGLDVCRPSKGDASMSRRLPRTERTRERLRDLIEGRLSSEFGRSELVKLATQLTIDEGLKASVRNIEDDFKDETGRLLLSKTAVSESSEQLWVDDRDFATQDLSEYDIAYLFVGGIAEGIRPGQRREPMPAAWGFTVEGRKVLLALTAGTKKDA